MILAWTAPPFDPEGGILLAVLRGLTDAGVLSLFGGVLFKALVLPPALRRWPPGTDGADALDRAQCRLLRAGLVVTAGAGFGWLLLQSVAMAGATGLRAAWTVVPLVLRDTRFGHLLLLQTALLLLLAAALRGRRWWSLPPALVLVVLLAFHGHAASMHGAARLLLPVGMLHLLAGGAWLGGLPPLLLAVWMAPSSVAAAAARLFSIWGKWSVLLVAATATIQGCVLVGSIPAITGTAYGATACVKLLLFGVLLGFACLNRYCLAPSLLRSAETVRARRRLLGSIGLQCVAGLAVLLAAGLLADLPPAMRMAG